MEKPIVWVHGDCLSPHHPGLQAYPHAPAIWVWDDALLAEWQIGLKRITFIYECLLELPVTIRRGDVVDAIIAFARENHADGVVTVESPSPRFESICEAIAEFLPIERLQVEPLVKYDGYIDLKRFSRYWRIAQRHIYE